MARIETALISVSDKTGLPQFAQRLARLGIHIISTGGTARLLLENGIPHESVADYTGLPEILDGRIKTLHHKVLAGLLALRDLEEHRRQMAEHGIRPIDMVVANLYPIGQVIAERVLEPGQAMVDIDIGGPTLIRAAAKNYTHVAVVTSPATYGDVADELERGERALSEETHFALALQAFHHTARYDRVVAEYLAGIHGDEPPDAGAVPVQEPVAPALDLESTRVLTVKAPTDQQWSELRLACWAVAYARAHAAALATGGRLVSLSAGRPAVVDAVTTAVTASRTDARNAVLAADGALPDAEALERVARAGVAAIVQLDGAPPDSRVTDAADRLGLVLVLTAATGLRY